LQTTTTLCPGDLATTSHEMKRGYDGHHCMWWVGGWVCWGLGVVGVEMGRGK